MRNRTLGAWTIALFFTGWKHAGENLAEVLKQRARELPAPIQMSDALSRNSPKVEGVEPLQANCLAHARRQVVEVADNFPEECRYVLETLRDVYRHDVQGSVIAFMPTQLHGYVVREAALFWQKSVSPGRPVWADRAEMNPGTSISVHYCNLFTQRVQ